MRSGQVLLPLDNKKVRQTIKDCLTEDCRGDWTRTSGLHVPNVARYQLRYAPKACAKIHKLFYFIIISCENSEFLCFPGGKNECVGIMSAHSGDYSYRFQMLMAFRAACRAAHHHIAGTPHRLAYGIASVGSAKGLPLRGKQPVRAGCGCIAPRCRLKPVGDVDFGEAVGIGGGSKGVGHLHRGANAVEAYGT